MADFMIPAAMFIISSVGSLVAIGHWEALIIWATIALVFFTYFQQKLLCSHCPHYAGPGHFIKCHAAYGLPKIPKYHARPLGRAEWLGLIVWTAVLVLYPFPFLITTHQWLLLAITSWALFSWFWFIQRHLCVRCVNVFCPFNRLPEALQGRLKSMLAENA